MSAFLVRLPTRVRVTIAFTAVMALLDRGLRSRAGDLTALVGQADSGLAQAGRSPLTEQGESLAQILDTRGRVVDASPPLRRRALLTAGEVRRATRGTILVDHGSSPVRAGGSGSSPGR